MVYVTLYVLKCDISSLVLVLVRLVHSALQICTWELLPGPTLAACLDDDLCSQSLFKPESEFPMHCC